MNWITIMEFVPESEDMYFISDDRDFYSEINPEKFNSYLQKEWQELNSSNLYSFRRISEFFKENFSEINIAAEYEKDALVQQLNDSYSFAMVRATLRRLSRLEDLSSKQINDFGRACLSNNQIFWIKDDHDIKNYITDLVLENRDKIESDLLKRFIKKYEYKIK